MTPFDEHPGFYEEDNRKFRGIYPITKEALINKHSAMFAEWNLKDKSILDLGCCLGATGQWCLFYGARSYTGVEAQKTYAEKAFRLLKHHGKKAIIIHSSIEEFFENSVETYDVVAMLGVIYIFVDYYSILRKAARCCNEYLIIESINTSPGFINRSLPAVEICYNQIINLADSHEHLSGPGTKFTPSALRMIVETLGFEQIGDRAIPRRIEESKDLYYSNPNKNTSVRYILRFEKTGNIIRSLSEDLCGSRKGKRIRWRGPEPVKSEKVDYWVFDENVAKNFSTIAKTNIPNYKAVIDKCINIACAFLKKDEPIIDVGSALGYTLEKLDSQGFTNLFGVDSSSEMLKRSFSRAKLIQQDVFPVELGPFALVCANWTLHFIKERQKYLQDIFISLKPNGFLILTEKVISSDHVRILYQNFKMSRDISEEAILAKDEALKDILVTYPLQWYLVILRKIGFRSVEIIDAHFSFTTFLAQK